MVAPTNIVKEHPTGKVRGRKGLFNKVILQVEICKQEISPIPNTYTLINESYYWRDLSYKDIENSLFYKIKKRFF